MILHIGIHQVSLYKGKMVFKSKKNKYVFSVLA